MRKIELILIAGAVIGLLMALLYGVQYGLIVSASITILSFLYVYIGFAQLNDMFLEKIFTAESYKGIHAWRISVAIGTGIGLSDLTVGFMLALKDYPITSTFLTLGLVLTSIVLLLASVRNAMERNQFYMNIIMRCSIFIILGVVALLFDGHLFQAA